MLNERFFSDTGKLVTNDFVSGCLFLGLELFILKKRNRRTKSIRFSKRLEFSWRFLFWKRCGFRNSIPYEILWILNSVFLYLSMATSIKQKLHELIDKIENESILNQAYELIYKKNASGEGDLWNKLTLKQQQELLLSLEESENPDNLISEEELKERYNKWL